MGGIDSARMPRRTKKPPADEQRLPVTPSWARSVRKEMRRRELGLRELSRQLDINHSTVGMVIRAECKTSPHVEVISRALDLPYPGHELSERAARMQRAAMLIERHDPAMLDRFIAFLEQQGESYAIESGLASSDDDVDDVDDDQ